MKKIYAAALAVAALSGIGMAALPAKADDNGVSGALASINSALGSISGVLSNIQASLNQIKTSLTALTTQAPDNVLITGIRYTNTAVGCLLVNAGTTPLTATVQPSRQFSGAINSSQFTIQAGGGGTIVATPPGGAVGGSYCLATITAGNPKTARLTLCADAGNNTCAAYSDSQ